MSYRSAQLVAFDEGTYRLLALLDEPLPPAAVPDDGPNPGTSSIGDLLSRIRG